MLNAEPGNPAISIHSSAFPSLRIHSAISIHLSAFPHPCFHSSTPSTVISPQPVPSPPPSPAACTATARRRGRQCPMSSRESCRQKPNSLTAPARESRRRSSSARFGVGHDATGHAGRYADRRRVRFDAALRFHPGRMTRSCGLASRCPMLHSHDGQGNDVWEWGVVYEYGVS